MLDHAAPPEHEKPCQEEKAHPKKDVKFALEEKWQQESQGEESVDDFVMNEKETGQTTVSDSETAVISPEAYQKAVQERDEYLDHLRRLQAEFDNYRKRVLKEKAEMRDLLIQDFIFQLLDIVEILERALHPDHETSDVESYRKGVEMIYQKFMAVLKDQGLSRIECVGQPFDPFIHEAVMQTETTTMNPGTVVAEITPGYFLKDRLLRPSRVQVAVLPRESEQGS
ncbi:MAG TPA: nucleotide exchange factor GrpE [bacterium]|nr:nucleotide exchange factor GrpE [bacterium]HPO99152.1 nucleotide exchange factor GrpE [bacterium]HXK92113.1 nucleotide exchange factor GrpE [bacterium]